MSLLRKIFLPWDAADCFDTEEAFRRWLQRCVKCYTDLRMLALVIAAACLILGYVMDLRPVMLCTIAPLALVLLFSVQLDKTEAELARLDKTKE